MKFVEKKRIYLLLFLVAGAYQAKAQSNGSDFGIWMDAGIEKSLGKKWTVYYRYQDQSNNDDDDLDTHVLGIGYNYKF